jgi:EAL domain-containing protein (putative c-di-GMP-specific phosphodiesterase class I)/GGDEF domain-containing protein
MVQRAENFIDTDTGLGKASAYVDNMGRSMKNGKSTTVVMINLTNYNALRDMLGYSGMQGMLKQVAKILIDVNREKNYGAELYYLGNGKFRFVLDYRHKQVADEIAQVMNVMLKSDITVNGMELNLVALVCVARCPEDIDDADSLMAFGNDLTHHYYTGEVLYASDIYQKKHYDIMRDMDAIIENALTNHRFQVYYQPIYSVEDHRFHSAEALLRLKDEEYGFISPELFIPVAEKNGAIHKIGSYVMEEVCKFIASEDYQTLGIDFIEINLSVTQCMRTNLAKDILDTMDKYHVRPDQINLEITETAASYSQNTMMENMETLTNAGIMFSLDDYGTGYSNMRRIASMPFDIVKLDKSFTNAEDNSKMQIVLENTIRMIKDMNMKIVVEGIETEKMVEQFSDLKCEYIQGFYYSKPVPKEEFVSFIKSSLGNQQM